MILDYSKVFVCLMGMGTVFFGLVCLVFLTLLMGRIVRSLHREPAPETLRQEHLPVAAENREEMVAAVSAALAEALGTDITGIRILSMTKL